MPGVSATQSKWLNREDFVIKTVERSSTADKAAYVLALASPIATSTRAIVRLRLTLDDDPERSFSEISFSTAEPFAFVSVGSGRAAIRWRPKAADTHPIRRSMLVSTERVVVELSHRPAAPVSPVEARQLVRFSPAVEALEYMTSGRELEISGDFERDTLYRVEIAPSPIHDNDGRLLEVAGASELYVFFPLQEAFLRWQAAQGVVERFGPQDGADRRPRQRPFRSQALSRRSVGSFILALSRTAGRH